MKRTLVAAAAVGSLGVAAVAFSARKRDVTDDRAGASRTVTVRRGANDLYDLWRSPEKAAQFFHGVRSIEKTGERAERWTLVAGGKATALDIEIVDETPGQRFEWRVAPKGPFEGQGSVTFASAPGGRGTEVRFTLALTGPGAKAASSFARLFGASVPQIAMESVRNFKSLAEAGEIPKAVRD